MEEINNMNPIQIQKQLEEMSNSLKEKDIIYDLPSIVKDLEFIIFDYPNEINNLTEDERINNIHNIEYHKINYLLELIRKYMKLTWSKEFKYEIVDGYLFNSSGGYNQKEDIVTVSIFGMILNTENTTDQIKTIAHEFRHQLQYKFLKEKELSSILDYPPYFINIIKNMLPKEIKTIVSEEGYVIDKPYYYDNYKRIYTEVDANFYAMKVVEEFLLDIYEKYPNKNKELSERVNILEKEILIEAKNTKEGLNNEGRIDEIYLNEIYTFDPINSKVIFDNKEEDSLLFINKTINKEDNIEEKYPVLQLIRKNNNPKNYIEIMNDKNNYLRNNINKRKIDLIYKYIVKSDPILIISEYIVNNNIKGIELFLEDHPTFIKEYKDEIKSTIELLGADEKIIKILTISKNKQKSML